MPFGRELSHLIEEQIGKAVATKSTTPGAAGIARRSGIDEGRIAQLEANLQRLAEAFTKFLGAQKKGKRNVVEYGLNVIALQGLRLAVTSGRAIFIDREEPIDLPYTYLQLSSGSERQIRYVYLDNTGVVLESSTDPTNIGVGYLPLAMVDVWSGATEITQDKIKDLRPQAGAEESDNAKVNQELTGNVTLYSPDTGNDSFIVSATDPARLKVNVTSGRALVDGEILNAEGGILDLTSHRNVVKEFLGISDGVKTNYSLYHKAAIDVTVYVDDEVTSVALDSSTGSVTFDTPPPGGAKLTASYTFTGNYMLVFLVEKAQTNDGHSFGVIGWKLGSNRDSLQPPTLTQYQHAIAKVDMSSSIMAITDDLIDNSYEVINLSQESLQRGGRLSGDSIAVGSITGDHITAQAITGQNIAVETITGPHIAIEAISGQHIAVEAITGINIAPDTITGDRIVANAITSDKVAANAITSDKVAANTITAGHIIASAITGDKLAANTITSDKVAANTITGDQIVANAITSDKVAANAITSDKVAANTITAGHIIASAITGDHLAANTITGDKVAAGTITGDKIIAGGIDAANIKTGAIQADHIAAGAINASHLTANSITADMIRGGTITADKFEDATWGDLTQAMRFVKSILGGEQSWKRVLSQTDLNIGIKSNVTVLSENFPSLQLDTQRHWDDGLNWDSGNTWDIPVYTSGYWESASIDYGAIGNLQAEFWAQRLSYDPAVTITVKARYSSDNTTWTDYETLVGDSTLGSLFWVGSLQQFRFFKVRVEFNTSNTTKYVLLGYPEVRAANCQIGTEDISNGAVSTAKLASGAVTSSKMGTGALENNIAILSGAVSHGGTIPLPSGYTQEQCKWMVSFREMYFSGNVDGNDSEYCYTDANRVVTVLGSEQRASFVANYIIIGIK